MILVTGAGGQLSRELTGLLRQRGIGEISLSRGELDIADQNSLQQVLDRHHPQVIFNCAAYTRVDRAESESLEAHRVNVDGPAVLAEACAIRDILLVHVSTDYVFDGLACRPYREDDPTHPLSIYGKSKLLGEQAIEQKLERRIVARTAWVYGALGNNFVRTMLRLAGEREELRVVDDQIGSPTWTGDLAEALLGLVEHRAAPGTYHITNSGVASWYDFAVAIVEEARSLGWLLAVERVVPIGTEEYPTAAVRPAYSVLSRRKTEAILGRSLPHWRTSLRRMLVQLQGRSL